MKCALMGIAVAVVGAMAFVHHAHAADATGALVHVRNSFDFNVHAPLKVAFPLFGAHGERVWAGEHWNPQFIYPHPEQDVPGMVFTVAHGQRDATWVNTAFDPEGGHAQYTCVIPGALATLIDIHLVQRDAATTQVSVVYERTALSADHNEHVHKMAEQDRASGPQWEQAINGYLEKKGK